MRGKQRLIFLVSWIEWLAVQMTKKQNVRAPTDTNLRRAIIVNVQKGHVSLKKKEYLFFCFLFLLSIYTDISSFHFLDLLLLVIFELETSLYSVFTSISSFFTSTSCISSDSLSGQMLKPVLILVTPLAFMMSFLKCSPLMIPCI